MIFFQATIKKASAWGTSSRKNIFPCYKINIIRRISSRSTFITKRLFPVFWFGFLAFFVVISLVAGNKEERFQPEFFLVPVTMAIFGYVIMKKLVFDLVDEVWDAGDELVVKNKGQQERIPLANIMNISYSSFTSPPRVTLTLREPGKFGKEVTFSPPSSFFPFSKSPIVDELIQRVDAKRKG